MVEGIQAVVDRIIAAGGRMKPSELMDGLNRLERTKVQLAVQVAFERGMIHLDRDMQLTVKNPSNVVKTQKLEDRKVKIVSVSVRYHPQKIDADCPNFGPIIISAPRPVRHGDILTPLSQMHPTAALTSEQGFLTDDGQFLNRWEARQIADKFRQTSIRDIHQEQLYSEDLW